MGGITAVSAATQAATRIAPKAGGMVNQVLPLFDDAAKATSRPKVVIVGIGRTPPPTTQSLVDKLVARGMTPGDDLIVTRYADLRLGKLVDEGTRPFVRLAEGTGADGMLLAGKGEEAIFVLRGGGNLSAAQMRKIQMLDTVEGAKLATDPGAIARLGSKALTNDVLEAEGLALARTIPVSGKPNAHAAYRELSEAFGEPTVVMKKVNSLGGKDVHFVKSLDDVDEVLRKGPNDEYVMQEFLAAAKDQDIRVHGVWNEAKGAYDLPNAYVRNRNAFQLTPNLANGGFPINYVLSPWEEAQVTRAMTALAKGSERPPLHVGLDLFPRRPITATVVEENAKLRDAVAAGRMSLEDTMQHSSQTAVIGEAASSAGTKGTELVLGKGNNPVTDQIAEGIMLLRQQRLTDAARGVQNLS